MSSLVLNERRALANYFRQWNSLELGKESLEERINRFFLLYKQLGNDAERGRLYRSQIRYRAAVGWFPDQN